jgi:hypothetical protein
LFKNLLRSVGHSFYFHLRVFAALTCHILLKTRYNIPILVQGCHLRTSSLIAFAPVLLPFARPFPSALPLFWFAIRLPRRTSASWTNVQTPSSGSQVFRACSPLGRVATPNLRGLPTFHNHYLYHHPLCSRFGHDPILVWYVINVIVCHVFLLSVLTLTYSGTPLSLPFVIPLSTATVVFSISTALM